MANNDLTKVTMNFRPDSIAKLDVIKAKFKRANKTDANAYAIDLVDYLGQRLGKGEKIMLKGKDGTLQEIVIPDLSA